MIVIVAEKPSVAQEIAKVVGATQKCEGYLQGNGYCVTWCYGHLCELFAPEDYDPKLSDWNMENLPIIPEKYRHKVTPATKKQFDIVSSLMNDPSTTEIVEATDAEREGELIFRTVQICAHCTNPNIKRLWINSLEEDAIREGLANMKDYRKYDNLYYAAVCRQRADWLIGINLTRFYSIAYDVRPPLTCGRVQTPVLNFIVMRDLEIETFVPKKYFIVTADMTNFKLSLNCDTREEAELIVRDSFHKQCCITKVEKVNKRKKAPPLYDLTTLQRECNALFGFSASQTLEIAQSLYEKKLSTYPRTDSKYITPSQLDSTTFILDSLIFNNFFKLPAGMQLGNLNYNILVNESKVGDHSAILPTKNVLYLNPGSVSENELKVLTLICFRLLMAVSDPYEYIAVSVEGDIGGHIFNTNGREDTREGYKRIERFYRSILNKSEKELEPLPALEEGELYDVKDVSVKDAKTAPPKRYTDGTLLSAMEHCGRDINEEELRDAMKDKGLGTPATRAAIIDKLIKHEYVERVKGKLISTSKGRIFIHLVVKQLKDPTLTAEWEASISDIRNGAEKEGQSLAKIFMDNITRFTIDFFKFVNSHPIPDPDAFIRERYVGVCPICKARVIDSSKVYKCENGRKSPEDTEGCPFVMMKVMSGKKISKVQARKLLETGTTDVIDGFKSKDGKSFSSKLTLDNGKVKFDFNKSAIGKCPLCRSDVFTTQNGYSCSNKTKVGEQYEGCPFFLHKAYYGKTLTQAQVRKVLETGKTDVIHDFVNREGKKFDAALIVDGEGKIKPDFSHKKGT